MIQKINAGRVNHYIAFNGQNNAQTAKTNVNQATLPSFSTNYTATSLVNAYQAFHGIVPAKTVSFGASLSTVLNHLKKQMVTCKDKTIGQDGEKVGSRSNINYVVDKFHSDLPNDFDAIKTNIVISEDEEKGTIKDARMQLKKLPNGYLYEIAVRPERKIDQKPVKVPENELPQLLKVVQDPKLKENSYILDTKGKLMAVVEDGNNILLTNTGSIKKINDEGGRLSVSAKQKNNVYTPFVPNTQEVSDKVTGPSIGEGTEIVIGMENGRFVPEIINSIEEFVSKVKNGEIVLNQFVANEDAKNLQFAMLAGGFGSRAEYTNASSDGIFHGKEHGAQSTKGVFRTATGLTPMETTFVSLHNAGLLDCSPENIGIGKNIKFYLNKSGVNKGNGGFTVDLYNKMVRDGREGLAILPNDSMSRMPMAAKKMADLMNTGTAAVAMIAKEVKSENAKGNFGIMKLGENNEILEFAEKPKEIPDGYEINGNCLTNTFQFAISKEAFKALSVIEPGITLQKGKETRDWSKVYIPVLMGLTSGKSCEEIQKYIHDQFKKALKEDVTISLDLINEAKEIVGHQKVYAVPTDEPWADVGTLNALYDTTMKIANGDFKLEDFERKHVLDSINTQTGLIASTPEQKAEIEAKYNIDGQVMVVPKAKKVNSSIVKEYEKKNLISVNEKQN